MIPPLIFLDIDGTLNTHATMFNPDPSQSLEAPCVACLNAIALATDAHIVVSSSWRFKFTLGEMDDLLCGAGLHSSIPIVGTTPDLTCSAENSFIATAPPRWVEIVTWMMQNDAWGSRRFVVLDDDCTGNPPNYVQTDPAKGLTPGDVRRAIALLNGWAAPLRESPAAAQSPPLRGEAAPTR